MMAILILLLAAVSRLVPHTFHGVAFNFTMVGAGLLFFGSRSPRWQAVLAVAVMALTDMYLTTAVYHYPFHWLGYLPTWAWYGAVCLLGSALLRGTRKGSVTVLRVAAGVMASATSFFLLSNFVVWYGSSMYAPTVAGLAQCFYAALPFYGNDLASTAVFAAVLFGIPALAGERAAVVAGA